MYSESWFIGDPRPGALLRGGRVARGSKEEEEEEEGDPREGEEEDTAFFIWSGREADPWTWGKAEGKIGMARKIFWGTIERRDPGIPGDNTTTSPVKKRYSLWSWKNKDFPRLTPAGEDLLMSLSRKIRTKGDWLTNWREGWTVSLHTQQEREELKSQGQWAHRKAPPCVAGLRNFEKWRKKQQYRWKGKHTGTKLGYTIWGSSPGPRPQRTHGTGWRGWVEVWEKKHFTLESLGWGDLGTSLPSFDHSGTGREEYFSKYKIREDKFW